MSYSRWSNSRWYTYHDCASGETKESQVFNVCNVRDFTFAELEEDILGCANWCVESLDSKNSWYKPELQRAHFWELVGLMATFMEDMEHSFGPKTIEIKAEVKPE